MRFADITGNDNIKRYLVNMADSGKVAHAMLLYENDGGSALAFAIAYAQYLNCPHRHDGDSCGECPSCNKISKLIHSDVHYVFPTNIGSKSGDIQAKNVTSDVYAKYWRELVTANPYFLENSLMSALGLETKSWDINVAEAKSIMAKLSLVSVEAEYKLLICYLPEKMRTEAANKLLKLVEEPPANTVFVFISHNPDKVLQTIMSRCQSLRLSPLSKEEIESCVRSLGCDEAMIPQTVAMAGGSLGKAVQIVEQSGDYEQFSDWFCSIMDASFKGDLLSALNVSEEIADLKSREKQKAFCIFVSDCLRKVIMLRYGMQDLSFVPSSQIDFYSALVKHCSDVFVKRISATLDKMVYYIDRNVSQKILFCDLVDRIFVNTQR